MPFSQEPGLFCKQSDERCFPSIPTSTHGGTLATSQAVPLWPREVSIPRGGADARLEIIQVMAGVGRSARGIREAPSTAPPSLG